MRASRAVRVAVATVMVAGAAAVLAPMTATPSYAVAPEVPLTPNGPGTTLSFPSVETLRAGIMGITGEQLTIATSKGSFSDNCSVQMTLRAPDHHVLAGPVCAGRKGAVAVPSLPADGRYVVSLAASVAGGSVTVAAKSAGGPPSITPDAGSLKVKWPFATNEDIRLGFHSAQNAMYSVVAMGGASKNRCQVELRVIDSSGNTVGGQENDCAGFGGSLFRITTPVKGTYAVQLLGYDSKALAVRLYKVIDQTGSLSGDGTPADLDLTTPGQDGVFTFHGTTGQRAAALVTSTSSGFLEVLLVRPDGSPYRGTVSPGFVDGVTLDQTGLWSVVVSQNGSGVPVTGTVQAFAFADIARSADLSGTPAKLKLGVGQRALLSFSGTTGQRVSAMITKSQFGPCSASRELLTLVRPDQSQAAAGACQPGGAYLDAFALDQTGTWTLVVDPAGAAAGAATFQSWNVVDQTGTITTDGTPVGVSTTVPGQNAAFTFTAATAESVDVTLSDSSFPSCNLWLVKAGGGFANEGGCHLTGGSISTSAIGPGTYEILVDPIGPTVGTATLVATATVD